MKKEFSTTKFEFLITLQDNIVCQRFFNVKGYNPDVRRSLELYYAVSDIVSDIQTMLKRKSIEYMFDNDKFLTNGDGGEENFIVQIKMGEDILSQRIFSASIYPPKVRYTVDVRPEIRNFLNKISDALSAEEMEKDYLGVEL